MRYRVGELGDVQAGFSPFGTSYATPPPKPPLASSGLTATARSDVSSFGFAKAAATAPVAAGPCGPEPARTKPGPLGSKRYDDVDAGARYEACLAAIERAKEKAYYDRVVAGTAGGEGGCGPDAKTVYNSGSEWTGTRLQTAWNVCRARAFPPTPAPAPPLVAEPSLVKDAPRPPSSSSSGYYQPPPPSPRVEPGPELVKGPAVVALDAPPDDTNVKIAIAVGLAAVLVGGGVYLAVRR